MSWGIVAGAAIGAVGSYMSSSKQAEAAESAAGAQTAAAGAGIAETQRQFDKLQELLAPFVTGGTEAFRAQQDLLGLTGPEAQQAAITGLEASPQFQALVGQGEEAILERAAATGGLRGGNVQAALAQFRPQMLAQTIESQLGRLGGLANIGQASAAGVGAGALQSGGAISNLLQQTGAAQAGSALAGGAAQAGMMGDIAGIGGGLLGGGGLGGLFGGGGGGGATNPSTTQLFGGGGGSFGGDVGLSFW